MVNYTSEARVRVQLARSDATIPQQWLDDVDALIDQYTGFSFKGATRTFEYPGSNNTLIRLPSRAASITSVVQVGPDGDSQTMSASTDYAFTAGSRFVERKLSSTPGFYWGSGKWLKGFKYVVTYVEPTDAPDTYAGVATDMAAQIFLFSEKYRDVGLATSRNESGTVTSLSGSSGQAYPASLYQVLRQIMTQGIRKTGV